MSQGNSMVWSAAREYAKNGIYVFPLMVSRKPDGKKDVRPLGLWRNISSTSLADIGAWEQQYPDAGLGIDCGKSGLVVIDPDGEEGVSNWLALFKDVPPAPDFLVETPGGGQHWYYRAHPDHIVGNDQDGKVAPKVDVRGLGGFVIAPPSSDGTGSWTTLAYGWHRRTVAPAVVVERMRAVAPLHKVAQVLKAQAGTDDLFEPATGARTFTEAQATDWIRNAVTKLKAAESGLNGAINDFAMVCAHFPWLVDREKCAALVQRHLGERMGWQAPDRDDLATINSAYSATEAGRSWIAVKVDAAPHGPAEGNDGAHLDILPPPGQPLQVARALVAQIPQTDCELHWAWWRDDFYAWTGAHWEVLEPAVIKRWVYAQTGDAVYLVPPKKEGEEFVRTPWAPTPVKVNATLEALGIGTLQRTGDAEQCIALENGVLAGAELLEHRPSRFNLSSLSFAYDPDAACPEWLKFLESSLPGDRQAHETIQEWMGYVLSGRTDLHKIGVFVGPPRCGKGTICRVLQAMVGPAGWAAPTLARLAGSFGLASMIGKSLAVMGDVRWTSKHVIDAVPVMLGISGEDGFTVERKNREDWIGRIPARLMLMSNDAPVFNDASGALAGRMVYVAFQRSFLGREDLELNGRLMAELPGILNWALEGLKRLEKQGFFTQSSASDELREDVDRDSSPVTAWVEDRCVLDPTAEFTLDALLTNYQDWLTRERLTFAPSLNRLSRELRSAFGDKGVIIDRKKDKTGARHRVVMGLRPIAGGSMPGVDLFDRYAE